jgi:hypothetical protein
LHYGKDFETVKRENQTFVENSHFIGAFYKSELIGFVKLVHDRTYSSLMQIISKVSHRDKAPTNALMARAVQVCTENQVPYLVYGTWSKRGLGDFKIHHGFECFDIPRYFVPLNLRGKVLLELNLHRKFIQYIPEKCLSIVINWRNSWNSSKYKKYAG